MTVSAGPARSVREARVVTVRGVVQGVGFRPFVHRLARRFHLAGDVRNVAADVEILVEGERDNLEAFVAALETDAPPLARIDDISVVSAPIERRDDFRVRESGDRPIVRPLISPDVAPCSACERELYDAGNRRAGYAFITCTDCGPRHSVIEDLPYDRERTSMRAFTQCPECFREYHDLDDRRYRSETNSCPACGPRVELLRGDGGPISLGDSIGSAAALLGEGAIVAVRGIGGFHLAVDATNEQAVSRLRRRKRRDGKPLAVMVRTIEAARELALVTEREAALLASAARPIVVLDALKYNPLAPSVTDGLTTVGLMLPCSPLHMLLLDAAARPLVMTSGNPTMLPLATTLDEARATLGDVADAFLTHDREIVMPLDDSVLRLIDGEPVMMRRSRGYAPLPLPIPVAAPQPILAVGAHLKNTFTLAEGSEAFVSHHISDLETIETVQHWERSLESLSRVLRIRPAIVARDLHPQYESTRLAERHGGKVEVVQHHHAHVAAVSAEHAVTEPVIGVAFDGTGFGDDGAIWGSEILIADLVSYRRMGHLHYAPLPGGDRAAREGWRAAIGYADGRGVEGEAIVSALSSVDADKVRVVRQQCVAGLNAPHASSMGRLFDAAAAILGICMASRYEGEAAMRLEAAAGTLSAEPIPMPLSQEDGVSIDPVPLLAELARRRRDGENACTLAAAFQESVVEATASTVLRVAERERLSHVALGGGSFQNARLLTALRRRLGSAGLRVLVGRHLSPNDGAISYGQAVVAAARALQQAR